MFKLYLKKILRVYGKNSDKDGREQPFAIKFGNGNIKNCFYDDDSENVG